MAHHIDIWGYHIDKNIIVTVVLVLALLAISCRAPRTAPPTRPRAPPRAERTPENQVLETNYVRAMEESGDRIEIEQAAERMRGRVLVTDQPAELQRGFDRDFDGIGASLNDTF